MLDNRVSRVLSIVVAVLAAVLVVGVLTFAGPCVHDDGSVSTCHNAQVGVIAAGIAAIVCSIVSLFVRNSKAVGALLVVAGLCGVFAAVAPGTLLPLCMMASMRCHVVMQPFAQFVGIAIAAVAIIGGIRSLRTRS